VSDSGSPVQVFTTNQISISVSNMKVTTAVLPFATNAQPGYTTTLAEIGGTAPFSWTVISGSLPAGMNLGANGMIAGTPTVTGIQTFTVQVNDSASSSATAVLSLNVLPELPRQTIDTTLPAPGPGSPLLFPGGTAASPAPVAPIQAALNANPPCGSVFKLQAGTYYVGKLVFPRHVPECTAATPIIITTDDPALPTPGTRVTPADAVHMPKILTNLTNVPALEFSQQGGTPGVSPGGSFYRLIGIEVSGLPAIQSLAFDDALVHLGLGETLASDMPHDIIIDRCFIHGTSTWEIRRGVLMNGVRLAVIDSNISDIHQTGADAQTIAGWNGPGPLKIQNNRLEASGENILFGGAIPPLSTNIPSDIEIRNNYFFKPLIWMTSTFSIKNHLEFKNGQRVLIEGNIFENNWLNAQVGISIVVTPRGLIGSNQGPLNYTGSEMTFRGNLITHVGGAFNFASGDSNDPAFPLRGFNVALLNNVILDANANPTLSQSPFGSGGGAGTGLQFLAGVPNVTIDHNTIFPDRIFLTTDLASFTTPPNRPNTPIAITNNVFQQGQYGVACSGFGLGNAALNNCFDDPATPTPDYMFIRNLILNLNTPITGLTMNDYPATNQTCDTLGTPCFPAAAAAAGVVDPANCNAGAFNPDACALNLFTGDGTDGKTLGADVTMVAKPIAPSVNPVRP
jgi:hypothetical protein